MSDVLDLRTVAGRDDPRSVFCADCTHSAFVHSDRDTRRCLFSECGCAGWRRPGERDETTAGSASAS